MSSAASRIAELVAEADAKQLASVLDAIRQRATDARTARRVIERHAPATLASGLTDLFAGHDFAVVLTALESALQAVKLTRDALGQTEIVWTGPETKTLSVRPTRAVVLELIARATSTLTLVTYASYDVGDLVKALDKARLERGVAVRVILETRDDSLRGEGPQAAAALKHLPLAVPVYRWPKERRGPTGASMHVKCLVRDGVEVFVSSANLTSAALDRNMELGLVTDGGEAARVIEQHFDDLIDQGTLVRLDP